MRSPRLFSVIVVWTAAVASPAPALAEDQERFAIRFEGGFGAMLSDFHRSERGFGEAWLGGARFGVALASPVALELGVANWLFPSNAEGTGWAFVPSAGLRFEPRIGSVTRFVLDAHGGVGFTGDEARFVFDVGVGLEFQPTPIFAFGPMLRYGQMVQPDTNASGAEPFPDDARFFAGGINLSLRFPSPGRRVAPRVEPATAEAPAVRPRDSDEDGVLDPDDLCPEVSQGANPDRLRRGCPTPDSDFDTVFDPDDRCVTVPQGPHPDPRRPGCPAPDRDGDGVFDDEDRCPTQPAGASPDAARPGCPDGDRDDDGVLDGVDRCIDEPETYNGVDDLDGCPETSTPTLAELDPQSHTVTLRGTVNFLPNSATIVGRASFEVIEGLANLLRNHPEIESLEVQGHTDARGDRAANTALSQRRADTVVAYLVSRGVAPQRLRAVGYGPDRPLDRRNTPEAMNANRRTEVRILRWREAPPATR